MGCGLGLLGGPGSQPVWPTCLAAAAALVAERGSRLSLAAALVAAALLGLWRAGLAETQAGGPLTPFRGHAVTLGGIVDDQPRCSERSCLFTLRVERQLVGAEALPLEARIQVRVGPTGALEFGSGLLVEGQLHAPRQTVGFPRAELLARRGIYEVLDFPRVRSAPRPPPSGQEWLEAFRAGLERRVASVVGGTAGQLTAGLLLGREVELPSEVRSQLRATGTSHIVAVSGFNVALLGGLVLAAAGPLLSRPQALGLATGFVLVYVGIVGAPPSAVRALLMFAAAALAGLVGRLPDPLTALTIAAVAMTAVDPSLGLQPGFQLSLSATAGLLLFGGRLAPGWGWLPRWLAGGLSSVLAVEAATLPIVLYHFHSLPLVAPVANLTIAPLVPLAMSVGTLGLLCADLPLLGFLSAELTRLVGELILLLIRFFAELPFATVATGRLSLIAVLVAYSLLLLPLAIVSRLPTSAAGPRGVAPWSAVAGSLVVLLVGGHLLPAEPPSGEAVRVRFFDVGSGSLSLVETPEGRRVLIGSSDSPLLVGALAEQLPLFERGIDLLVVSRASETDLAGLLAVVQAYPVAQVLQPPLPAGSAFERWRATLTERGVAVVTASGGQSLELGPTARLQVVEAWEAASGPAATSLRLTGEGLELWLPGSSALAQPPAGERLVIRLPRTVSLERASLQTLGAYPGRVVLVGGRQAAERTGLPRLPLEGGEVVEVRFDSFGARLERRPCDAAVGPCGWP